MPTEYLLYSESSRVNLRCLDLFQLPLLLGLTSQAHFMLKIFSVSLTYITNHCDKNKLLLMTLFKDRFADSQNQWNYSCSGNLRNVGKQFLSDSIIPACRWPSHRVESKYLFVCFYFLIVFPKFYFLLCVAFFYTLDCILLSLSPYSDKDIICTYKGIVEVRFGFFFFFKSS